MIILDQNRYVPLPTSVHHFVMCQVGRKHPANMKHSNVVLVLGRHRICSICRDMYVWLFLTPITAHKHNIRNNVGSTVWYLLAVCRSIVPWVGGSTLMHSVVLHVQMTNQPTATNSPSLPFATAWYSISYKWRSSPTRSYVQYPCFICYVKE